MIPDHMHSGWEGKLYASMLLTFYWTAAHPKQMFSSRLLRCAYWLDRSMLIQPERRRFKEEEGDNKVQCKCGAPNCRGTLN